MITFLRAPAKRGSPARLMAFEDVKPLQRNEREIAERVRLRHRARFLAPRLAAEAEHRERLKRTLLAKPPSMRTAAEWKTLGHIADHYLFVELGIFSPPPIFEENRDQLRREADITNLSL